MLYWFLFESSIISDEIWLHNTKHSTQIYLQVQVSEGMEELSGNSNNNEMGNGLSG